MLHRNSLAYIFNICACIKGLFVAWIYLLFENRAKGNGDFAQDYICRTISNPAVLSVRGLCFSLFRQTHVFIVHPARPRIEKEHCTLYINSVTENRVKQIFHFHFPFALNRYRVCPGRLERRSILFLFSLAISKRSMPEAYSLAASTSAKRSVYKEHLTLGKQTVNFSQGRILISPNFRQDILLNLKKFYLNFI